MQILLLLEHPWRSATATTWPPASATPEHKHPHKLPFETDDNYVDIRKEINGQLVRRDVGNSRKSLPEVSSLKLDQSPMDIIKYHKPRIAERIVTRAV